jgi:hypothetical protein
MKENDPTPCIDDITFAYIHVWITSYGIFFVNISYGKDLECEILGN